jgi:hypothetical protein
LDDYFDIHLGEGLISEWSDKFFSECMRTGVLNDMTYNKMIAEEVEIVKRE